MIPAAAVLAPVSGFLMAMAAMITLGMLREAGLATILALAAMGAGSCFLIRKQRVRSWNIASVQTELERGSLARVTKPADTNVMPFPASPSRCTSQQRGHIKHQ
jgi:hypothetical protein